MVTKVIKKWQKSVKLTDKLKTYLYGVILIIYAIMEFYSRFISKLPSAMFIVTMLTSIIGVPLSFITYSLGIYFRDIIFFLFFFFVIIYNFFFQCDNGSQ